MFFEKKASWGQECRQLKSYRSQRLYIPPTLGLCGYKAFYMVFPPSSPSSHCTWTAAIRRLGISMLAEQRQRWDSHTLVERLGWAWPCIVYGLLSSIHQAFCLCGATPNLPPEDTSLSQLKSKMLQTQAKKIVNPACLILEFPNTMSEGQLCARAMLYVLPLSLSLTTALQGCYYYLPYFTDEESES